MLFVFEFCADGEVFGLRDSGEDRNTRPGCRPLTLFVNLVSALFFHSRKMLHPWAVNPRRRLEGRLCSRRLPPQEPPSIDKSMNTILDAPFYITLQYEQHMYRHKHWRRSFGLFTSQVLFAGSLRPIGGTIWSWRLIQTELWLNSMLKCTV